jgi:hypothetical protein
MHAAALRAAMLLRALIILLSAGVMMTGAI